MFQPGAMLCTQGFGNRPENVEVPVILGRPPASTDSNYPIGKVAIDNISNASYTLTSTSSSGGTLAANWVGTGGGTIELGSLTPDSGTTPVVPVGGNIAIAGSGSTTTVGGTNILTVQLTGLTNHNVLIGAGTTTITKLAPSATSGVAIISQGASADPAYGTVVVAGGGTGAVTLTGILSGNGTSAVTASTVTQHGVLLGGASNAVTSLGVAGTGTVLTGVNGADPVFSSTISGTLTTSGFTSNGNITINNGNLILTTAAAGLNFQNSGTVSGTTTATINARIGQITITTPSIAGGDTFGFTISNTTITGSSTQVGYWLSGGTTGSALTIQSYANTGAQSVVTINNGTGATTNTASLILNFLVLN